MKDLSLQDEINMLRKSLETYAAGLEDKGEEASSMIQYLDLHERSIQCSRCSEVVLNADMKKDKGRLTTWCKICSKEYNKIRRSMKHKPLKALELALKRVEKLPLSDMREIRFQWSLVWKNIKRLK